VTLGVLNALDDGKNYFQGKGCGIWSGVSGRSIGGHKLEISAAHFKALEIHVRLGRLAGFGGRDTPEEIRRVPEIFILSRSFTGRGIGPHGNPPEGIRMPVHDKGGVVEL